MIYKRKKSASIIVLFMFFFAAAFVSAQGSRDSASLKDEKLVFIESGTFFMGSPESEMWREPDETRHEVTLDSFYIGRFEVSQKEYAEIMGENPSSFQGDDLPVENVSWYDAVAFCNALSRNEYLEPAYTIDGSEVKWNRDADGYRLPTEAEWEYACRAGTTTPFSTGDNISVEEANYFGTYPYTIEDHYWSQDEMETSPGVYREQTVEVDRFRSNPWGLYNIHGNVSEWCYDVYGEYPADAADNPSGPDSGSLRICRGGGWNDFGKHLRSAFRSAIPADDIFGSRGFRVVRSAGE